MLQTLLADDFLDKSQNAARQFAEKLRDVSRDLGLGEVRGAGRLLALELGCGLAPQIVSQARDHGLLLNAPRPHCLRFMPALNMNSAEVDEGMAILRQVLAGVLGEVRRG